LKGGHVIDPRNRISAVRDVAIANGKVAAIAANIAPAEAFKVVDASGYYVTPGLVDIHVHVYAGTGERGSYAGDNSLYPDGFTLRSGVTTVVDAGSSGWRTFEDFKQRIIDRSGRASGTYSTSSARDARRQVRTEPGRYGSQADRGDGASPQGCGRRHQDGALRRP
jgi:predicted amidohydrolase